MSSLIGVFMELWSSVRIVLRNCWRLCTDLSGLRRGLAAIIRFEAKRVMTPGRAFWWILVALFPIAIAGLLRYVVEPQRRAEVKQFQQQQIVYEAEPGIQSTVNQVGGNQPIRMSTPPRRIQGTPPPSLTSNREQIYTVVLYLLGPSIACMLGALLFAAPAIASELEQHTWIYLTTRPNGIFYLVTGKYIVAVLWSFSATCVGVLGGAAIVGQDYGEVTREADGNRIELALSQLDRGVGVDESFPMSFTVTNRSPQAVKALEVRVRHSYEFELPELKNLRRDDDGTRLAESIDVLEPGESRVVEVLVRATEATRSGRVIGAVRYSGMASQIVVMETIQVFSKPPHTFLWRTFILVATSFLSAMAYSAIYLVIGAIFPKKAMVFCVAYSIGAEGILSMLPAVVNRLTVQYRLRSFLFHHLEDDSDVARALGEGLQVNGGADQPLWLGVYSLICLGIALGIVLSREFTQATESDV